MTFSSVKVVLRYFEVRSAAISFSTSSLCLSVFVFLLLVLFSILTNILLPFAIICYLRVVFKDRLSTQLSEDGCYLRNSKLVVKPFLLYLAQLQEKLTVVLRAE